MSGLIRLYPRAWRQRYGDEFLALMSERPPTLRDRLDIVRGALDAHLFPQLPGPDLVPDRSGLLPLAGAVSIGIGVFLALNGPVQYDEDGSYRDGAAALPFIIGAMALLAVGLYHLARQLPRDAVVGRGAATLAIICGLFWSMVPWVIVALAAFLGSILVLATSASRAHVWPRWLTGALSVLVAIPASLTAAMTFLPYYTFRETGLILVGMIAPLVGIWMVFGVGLLRGFPPTRAILEAD